MRLRITAALLSCVSVLGTGAAAEPLRFHLEGVVRDGDAQDPVGGARIAIHRAESMEVLVDEVWTGADGRFFTLFEVDPDAWLESDRGVRRTSVAGSRFWMGGIQPNPVGESHVGALTLPYFAPGDGGSAPSFEMYTSRGRRVRVQDTLASGVYFYRLRFGAEATGFRKLVLLSRSRIVPALQRRPFPEREAQRVSAATRTRGTDDRQALRSRAMDVIVVVRGERGESRRFLAHLDADRDNQFDAILPGIPVPTTHTSRESLASSVEGSLQPGTRHEFSLELDEGRWFSIDLLGRGGGIDGLLTIVSPSGVILERLELEGPASTSRPVRARFPGEYRVVLDGCDRDVAYTLHFRDVPTVSPGETARGPLVDRGTRYLHFAAQEGAVVRAALDQEAGFTGTLSIVDQSNREISSGWGVHAMDGTPPTPLPSSGDYFLRFRARTASLGVVVDYSCSLHELDAPVPLDFDRSGHAETDRAKVDRPGDVHLYRFSGRAGDGVIAELSAGRRGSLGAEATVEILRLGPKGWRFPGVRVASDFDLTNPGVEALGILEVEGAVLPQDDTYLVVVRAPAPQAGEYELSVDRLTPSLSIVVDDDLRQSENADTRSLRLAALIAPPRATIEVCPGDYSSVLPVTVASPRVSIVGSSMHAVTIGLDGPGTALRLLDSPRRIAHLSISTAAGAGSTGIYVARGSGVLIEDVLIGTRDEESGLDAGVFVASGVRDPVLRRVTFRSCRTEVEGITAGLAMKE